MTAPHPLSYFDRLAPFDGRLWGRTFKDHSWQREPGPPTDTGVPHTCPACGDTFDYAGPLNPLRFPCPHCCLGLTWRTVGYEERTELGDPLCSLCSAPMAERNGKYGKFWGCSAYAKTKCKGKPGPRPRIIVTEMQVELALWVDGSRGDGERMSTRIILEELAK